VCQRRGCKQGLSLGVEFDLNRHNSQLWLHYLTITMQSRC
jgi:hypothetical protein